MRNWIQRSVMAVVLLGLSAVMVAGAQSEPPDSGSPLVVVTSFPEGLYATVQEAFHRAHPQIDLQVINKKTAAAIFFIQQPPDLRPDLFWASSPDAFEILKQGGHLQVYRPSDTPTAATINHYPIHDPDGYYTGFAISGYGMMTNRSYLKAHRLSRPASWADLTAASYFGHIGMSTPSRSGTTHMAVESILQYHGWEPGWRLLLKIGGNLATITARSFGVADGVNSGRFGIGIAIDFFGLSARASGHPVDFTYARESAMLPASIAVLNNAPHPEAATRFVDFLLSEKGQRLLFAPHIRRLPVVPSVYSQAPKGYPNPFSGKKHSPLPFDSQLSQRRYQLVNALFDNLITFRRNALRRTWQAIHQAETRWEKERSPGVRRILDRARRLAMWLPVDAGTADDVAFTSLFVRKRRGQPLPPRQAQLEAQWEQSSINNLKQAQALAQQALAIMLEGEALN